MWGFRPVGIPGTKLRNPQCLKFSGDSVQWEFRSVGIPSSGDSVQWGFRPVGIPGTYHSSTLNVGIQCSFKLGLFSSLVNILNRSLDIK